MYLGAHHQRLASVAEVAEFYGISRNHLVKVVQGLTEHGFVETSRGKNGGMQLARYAKEISVGEVVRLMEKHFDIVECFNHQTGNCVVDGSCVLKGLFRRAVNNFLKELDGISLADILKPDLRRGIIEFQGK